MTTWIHILVKYIVISEAISYQVKKPIEQKILEIGCSKYITHNCIQINFNILPIKIEV